MKPATLALVGLAAFAAFTALAHQQATSTSNADLEAEPSNDFALLEYLPGWDSVDLWGMTTAAIESNTVQQAIADPNTAAQTDAFLTMISRAEGTDRAADPYRVCYSYRHTIEDLRDHPAVTGEWKGESIANLGPQYAGKISTAAGRYQIIKPTWLRCKKALGLVDFSPASQDLAALYLVKGRGALEDVQSGDIATAIAKCRNEWASLPGGDSGQPQRRLEALLQTFTAAGGYVA